MKKIIIRTPNFIGDTINTTPCLELIKQEYPEAEFTIVGPDFVRELFKYDPRITHYITFPLKRKKKLSTYWKIVRELRKEYLYFCFAFQIRKCKKEYRLQ